MALGSRRYGGTLPRARDPAKPKCLLVRTRSAATAATGTIADPRVSRMGARMAETVELATIWLVDLVGSTRLATAVGPVRADSLRDEYFALLRDAIDASGGRAFKNTGDGLFVA